MLIQQNLDGSDFFNRSWAEFKVGFNNSRGNYWLGNDLLSQLTLSGRYKLRFDLELVNASSYKAEYSSFEVENETSNYTLRVSGFSRSNARIGNAFGYHNGMMFTTYDRDNDPWTGSVHNSVQNCAVHSGGGFWYRTCGHCTFNTVRGRREDFKWYSAPDTANLHLQSSRMWLIC